MSASDKESAPSKQMRAALLGACGVLSLIGYLHAAVGFKGSAAPADVYGFLALFGSLFVLYFLTLAVIRRGAAPRWTAWILGGGLLFRLALLPAGLEPETWGRDLAADLAGREVAYRTFLLYDNDVGRYLWDGHVLAHGLDPYAAPPAALLARWEDDDPAMAELFDDERWIDVYDNVYYGGVTTVYPPLAQLLFRTAHAVAPASVAAWKLLVIFFDLAACAVLASLLGILGRRREWVVVYAWNPLVIKEFAGSGHVDAVLVFFLVLAVWAVARGRPGAGLVAFAGSVLIKLTPALLVIFFLRRAPRRSWIWLPLVVGGAYLPFFASLGEIARGVVVFAREWVFNPGPWLLFRWLAESMGLPGRATASLLAGASTLLLLAWALRRDDGGHEALARGIFVVLGGYVVLSATVMPWYLLSVLPMVALLAGRCARCGAAWLGLTALSLLSYLNYLGQGERAWWLWVEFGGGEDEDEQKRQDADPTPRPRIPPRDAEAQAQPLTAFPHHDAHQAALRLHDLGFPSVDRGEKARVVLLEQFYGPRFSR